MPSTFPSPSPGRAAIVGAGIVGLAHAWSAARRGWSVEVFERTARAEGASIRNFGMIWPIGQPAGERRQIAMRSRECWLELSREAGLWVNPCGSIHLAHRDDEWAVLKEFAAQAPSLGIECNLLTPAEVIDRTPAALPQGLRGGLWSPAELAVNPRTAIPAIAGWLAERFGVRFHFETTIRRVDQPSNQASLETMDGQTFAADHVVVCGGADLRTLFPDILNTAGLRPCKLQMMKTVPQPAGWRLGPHLASGLTLRHYASFAAAPSLASLKRRVADQTPELDRYGIHVMASQNDAGEVILGDSHEYDSDIDPFDKAAIDALILRELRKQFQLPDWTISQRWNGTYVKHADLPAFEAWPFPSVLLVTGIGGAGITMSFGLAEEAWAKW